MIRNVNIGFSRVLHGSVGIDCANIKFYLLCNCPGEFGVPGGGVRLAMRGVRASIRGVGGSGRGVRGSVQKVKKLSLYTPLSGGFFPSRNYLWLNGV